MPTALNQKSMARLVSINSIDDFCLFAPPEGLPPSPTLRYTEEVAWCMQPRNNARVIPDGTIKGLTFLKTDFYVQIMGHGDFTKLNVKAGDSGGELDPHGAEGSGNPVGGNITTTVADGTDLQIEEWMMYMSADEFCFRACYNANSTYASKYMCEHKLDVMGCQFVMPGTYHEPGGFESCEADVAYPPGWYPTVGNDGKASFSVFEQYWTGVVNGVTYTVGDTITPNAPAATPASSNCVTKATISNGIPVESLAADAPAGAAPPPGFTTSVPLTAPTGFPPGVNGDGAKPPVKGSASANAPSSKSAQAGPSATNKLNSDPKSAGSNQPSTSGSSATTGPSGASAAFRGARIGYSTTGEFAGIAIVSLVTGLAAILLLH
ncbi:hypothetical protein R3P38DRAFT_2709373 [Favolaschia claudopus]|uniref:Uncharacterized protein n=1 Tax=Favolaschia claudopus TaxID=2862362 RepID=A0AAW0B9J5_9AGAR